MGLDWHCVVRVSEDEYTTPCEKVNALRMKDRPTFVEDIEKFVKEHKDNAHSLRMKNETTGEPVNFRYVEFWEKRTVEEEIEYAKDKFDCETCPLLKELQGADSSQSLFLGVTVAACDFRGKRISANEDMPDDIVAEAYEAHDCEEMLLFAEKLEQLRDKWKKEGKFTKTSYPEYIKAYEDNPLPDFVKGPKLTASEFMESLHWMEQDLADAIHWLRTCAKHGLSMRTSY